MSYIYIVQFYNRIKIGITRTYPKLRLNCYKTSDPTAKYHTLIHVSESTLTIFEIEDYILSRTYDYIYKVGDIIPYTNNEVRYCEASYVKSILVPFLNTNSTYIDMNEEQINQLLSEELNDNNKLEYINDTNKIEEIQKLFVPPIILRGFQVELYKELKHLLDNNDKVNLNVICGCGKTVLFQKYIEDSDFQNIIYASPSISLIENMKKRFNSHITHYNNYTNNNDIIDINKKSIIFSCYDSMYKLKDLKFTSKVLIIYDEAHRLTDEYKFSPFIDISSKQLFVTATPKISNNTNNAISNVMNNINIYGSARCSFYDFKLAIEQKFITDMKIITPICKDDTIINAIDCVPLMLKEINDNPIYNYKPKKILVYTNTIKKIDELYEHYEDMGYNVYRMSSNKCRVNSAKVLELFNDCSEGILINCQKITEGVDIPDLDSIVFIDPKYVESDIIQAIFRARRYNKNQPNKIAYIIIPYYSKDDDLGNYNSIINIINKLQLYGDPYAIKYIKDTQTHASELKNKLMINNITCDISNIIDVKIYNLLNNLSAYYTTEEEIKVAIDNILHDDEKRNQINLGQTRKFKLSKCIEYDNRLPNDLVKYTNLLDKYDIFNELVIN